MDSAGIAQLVEQLICNSSTTVCAAFQDVAQCDFSELTRGKLIRAALRRITGFCNKNRVDRRSDRENSTTFARARGIVRASYASIRVFPWRAQLRPRALRPWITAATSILKITASSQRLCSCFRVLLNASCVNRTAPRGSSVIRKTKR